MVYTFLIDIHAHTTHMDDHAIVVARDGYHHDTISRGLLYRMHAMSFIDVQQEPSSLVRHGAPDFPFVFLTLY